ncbi:MAG: CDP-alcohol phosphatidyltransferase family protein [Candidatus Comchoanobacterales bacterium]
MFDALVRPIIDPPLNHLGCRLSKIGISPNTMTLIGFACGIMAMVLIGYQHYVLASLAVIANRLADGLDGAIARHTQLSDFGGFLDIVVDFIIYSGIVFAFGISHSQYLWPALLLIFSFIGPIASFLAYAIIASKRNINTKARGQKSFYYLGGLCEGTETAFILVLMCWLPQYFNIICMVYGALCWLTTIGRIYAAWIDFSD